MSTEKELWEVLMDRRHEYEVARQTLLEATRKAEQETKDEPSHKWGRGYAVVQKIMPEYRAFKLAEAYLKEAKENYKSERFFEHVSKG